MDYKDVFLDFDGTLCDTELDIKLAWKATLEALGRPTDRFDAVYTTGPAIDDITRKLFPEEYTPELVADIRANFAPRYDTSGFPNSKPYPGIIDWLKKLRAHGTRPHIVTNKRYAATQVFMDVLGWRNLICGVYASDMYRETSGVLKKPALLAEALKREGASASTSVMIGDTKGDIDAGKANGLHTIGVTWGYGSRDELAEADELWNEVP